MTKKTKITVLVENTVYKRGLLAEHGLSLLIEVDGRRILFDTGQGNVIAHNMEVLEIDPSSIDDLVLSHRHYDHTGGVDWILNANDSIRIVAHPDLFEPCFSQRKEGVNAIAVPDKCVEALRRRKESIQWVRTPYAVTDSLIVTGEIPLLRQAEQTDSFYRDQSCNEAVSLKDDLSLCIETDKGLVVVFGCCHSGVKNTVEYITSIKKSPIYAVIGGMHLRYASSEQVHSLISFFNEHSISLIAPAHCTGPAATSLMEECAGATVTSLSVGDVIDF